MSVRAGAARIRIGLAASATLAGVALGCATADPTLAYVRADERSVDLYADRPAAPAGPITTGEDALAIVLRDEALIRHLRRMDASYSGRRRERLAWNGAADFEREAPEPRKGEAPSPDETALREAVATEGGFWVVRVSSDVRETQIFYVCELRVAPSGRPLGGFEPKRTCKFLEP